MAAYQYAAVKGMVLSIIVFLPVLLCGFTEIRTLENTRGGERARTLSSTSSRNQRNEGEIMQNEEASAVKKVRLSEIDSSYVNVMEYGAVGMVHRMILRPYAKL